MLKAELSQFPALFMILRLKNAEIVRTLSKVREIKYFIHKEFVFAQKLICTLLIIYYTIKAHFTLSEDNLSL